MTVLSAVSVQEGDFDVGAEVAALYAGRDDIGAVATFVGLVRADKAGSGEARSNQAVVSMTLEHYPGMTEAALGEIIDEALERWPVQAVRVIHRVGRLMPGERIVFVGVASPHRAAAFAACAFIMDYLKTRAPFWKKETTSDGGGRWVDARESDLDAAACWDAANSPDQSPA